MSRPRMSIGIRTTLPWATVCMLALALLPLHATAQNGVQTTSHIEVEFGGGMGAMIGAMQQEMPDETVTTVQGTWMRSDQGPTSSIFNYSDGTMIVLNHDDQTYFSGSMSELMQMGMQEGQMSEEEMAQVQEMMSNIEAVFSVEPTGNTMNIGGYDAEQVYMTMEVDMSSMADMNTDPQAAAMASMMNGMRMVYFAEMWMSKDHPSWEVQQQVGESFMDMMRNSGAPGLNMMSAFMGEGGDLWEAMDISEEEMEAMMGMQMKTTALMYFVSGDQEFDSEVAMGHLEGELPSEGGLGAMMGAMMGGGGGSASLSPLMRMVQTVTDTQELNLPASTFEVPSGYTQMSGGMEMAPAA